MWEYAVHRVVFSGQLNILLSCVPNFFFVIALSIVFFRVSFISGFHVFALLVVVVVHFVSCFFSVRF